MTTLSVRLPVRLKEKVVRLSDGRTGDWVCDRIVTGKNYLIGDIIMRVKITIAGRYTDRATTVQADVRRTVTGREYLHISARQMREARARCCITGDYPHIASDIDGYGYWQSCVDGAYVCYKIA